MCENFVAEALLNYWSTKELRIDLHMDSEDFTGHLRLLSVQQGDVLHSCETIYEQSQKA